jgi:hypothetical protein
MKQAGKPKMKLNLQGWLSCDQAPLCRETADWVGLSKGSYNICNKRPGGDFIPWVRVWLKAIILLTSDRACRIIHKNGKQEKFH